MADMTPERRLELLSASRLGLAVLSGGTARFAFNPDQSREVNGRFGSGGGGSAGAGGEFKPAGDGKHGVALPKNPKKLNIAEAHTALKEMGYQVGGERYDLKAKTSLTDLAHPDGTTSTVTSDQVKSIVYGGKRAAGAGGGTGPAKPDSVDDLRRRLKDAEAKVAAAHTKVAAVKGKAAKAPAKGGGDGVASVSALYDRAGRPGLTEAEIQKTFDGAALHAVPMKALRALAEKLDVAAGKLNRDTLVHKLQVSVKNRAGTHARVRGGHPMLPAGPDDPAPRPATVTPAATPKAAPKAAKLPKPPKAEKVPKPAKPPKAEKPVAPAAPHAEVAARVKQAVDRAIGQMQAGTQKGAGRWKEDVLGKYDEAATHKVFDEALAAAKTRKDLVSLLGHLRGGIDAKTERWYLTKPRKELERHFYDATRGRIGSFWRAHV